MGLLSRRVFLGTALAAGVEACSPGDDVPPPAPLPSSSPARCVSLAEHQFERHKFCNTSGGTGGVADDRLIVLPDYHGPAFVTATTLTAWFMNAIVEWDTRTGRPIRLLAPQRSENRCYVLDGDRTITTRCGGALVIHAGGCAIGEIGTAGLTPLEFVSLKTGRVACLDSDHHIRIWDTAHRTRVASRALPPAARFISATPGGQLLMTNLDDSTLSVLDGTSLETVKGPITLPPTTGWMSTAHGAISYVNDTENPGALLLDSSLSKTTRLVTTQRPPQAATVSNSGLVAVSESTRVHFVRPGAKTLTITSKTPNSHVLAFSPDSTRLFAIDSGMGITAYDTTTTEPILSFKAPREP